MNFERHATPTPRGSACGHEATRTAASAMSSAAERCRLPAPRAPAVCVVNLLASPPPYFYCRARVQKGFITLLFFFLYTNKNHKTKTVDRAYLARKEDC